jgi:hypothetical protein
LRQTATDELNGYRPVAALDALAWAASDAQVVMINEAHHVPRHRAFILALLQRLRRQGFTYFDAETLYAADTRLKRTRLSDGANGLLHRRAGTRRIDS